MTELPDTVEFTTNAGEHGSLGLTRSWVADVEAAVEEEHGACEDASCDIAEALKHGFPLAAAYLLDGATETPALDTVRATYEQANAIPEGEDYLHNRPSEWDAWVEHFKKYGRACEACGSYTFATEMDEPEICANCHASLIHDYVIAVVMHVRANTAGEAFRTIAEDMHPEEGEPLFQSNAYRIEEVMASSPDYSVAVTYGRTLLEPVPADEEDER